MSIVGSYKLVSWVSGRIHPFGKNAIGKLIYTDTGHYSIAMSKQPCDETTHELFNNPSSVAYVGHCGKYKIISDDQIKHYVEVSSHSGFIGKELARAFKTDNKTIVLSGSVADDNYIATFIREEDEI